uniref:Uncharacterized protein n=1 Tax=Entomoneis paludosa TaxID=265537 RepID=A0A7S3DS59_9STRA|mmetsp:Transcript_31110/g.64909  ORF Transcript_31110/g.64909 Transcript_31110/m.64909 type:complete len:655 (+) Transcript_31110:110-2074(+)
MVVPEDRRDATTADRTTMGGRAGPSMRHFFQQQQASVRSTLQIAEVETKKRCFPYGFDNIGNLFHTHPMSTHAWPLVLSVFAMGFTGAGSWDCSYFQGATIAFTGSNYGLWTLEDSSGKCQLWNVLFFSYNLGWHLVIARVFSMTAMLLGLGLLTTTAQALQFHLVSWGIGLFLFVLFIISVSTSSVFNLWIVFWLFSYVIMTLIVRFAFVHPVPRRISLRGEKVIARLYVFNGICCLLTLLVLKSDYCTCKNLSSANLEGRQVGEPCEGNCRLGPAGIQMILASFCWFLAARARFKFRIQPSTLKYDARRPPELYAHYPHASIYTQVTTFWKDRKKEPQTNNNTKDTDADRVGLINGANEDPNTRQAYGATDPIARSETWEPIPDTGKSDVDEDDLDDRGFFQKLCCDFFSMKRNQSERIVFWSLRVMLATMLVIYVFFIYMLIGSRIEYNRAGRAPSTTPSFTTKVVCGFDPENPSNFQTFEGKELAHLAGYTIAHCGACSQCSNPHDIKTYVETRKTIADSSKQCGPYVYLGTKDDVTDCLQKKIGFTRDCTMCWTEDMISTGKNCLSTCLTTLFSGFMTDNNIAGAGDQGWLNACVFCDEKISGPGFVACSGVARRRLGIVSEIERNPEEQCQNTDIDWVNVDWEGIGFV